MPNTKPKDYNGAIDVPDLPHGAIDQIIDKSKLCFDESQKKRLKKSSIEYLADRELLDKAPRRSEKKAAIKKLLKKSDALLTCLKGIDSHTYSMLIRHMYEGSRTNDLNTTVGIIRELVNASEAFLSEIPDDSGGRTRTTGAIAIYIKKLANLYKETSGIEPTASAPNIDNYSKGSPFFHFVGICLKALNLPPDTDFSLQNSIREALSNN